MNTRAASANNMSAFAILFVASTAFSGLAIAAPAHADYGALPIYNSIDAVCSGRNDPNCLLKETQADIQQSSQYQPQFSQNYYNSNQKYQSYNSEHNHNYNTSSFNWSYVPPTYSYYNTPSSYYNSYPSSYWFEYQYSYSFPSYADNNYGYTPVTNSSLHAPWTYYPTSYYSF